MQRAASTRLFTDNTLHVYPFILASGEVPGSPLAKFITVSVSAIASSAGPTFSGRKEIVNSLAFVLDKHFGLHFATAHNSRPLLIPLRLYWCATQSQNTISLRSSALFLFNAVPSSNLRRSHRFLQHKQKWRTTYKQTTNPKCYCTFPLSGLALYSDKKSGTFPQWKYVN